MSIVLPALAVAFAAFCVWLGVRIFNRRERWAKQTLAAVIGLPVLYIASFGPACWWDSRVSPPAIGNGTMTRTAHWPLPSFYRPLLAIACSNAPSNAALSWYVNLGAPRGTQGIIVWVSSSPIASERTPELLWPVKPPAPPIVKTGLN